MTGINQGYGVGAAVPWEFGLGTELELGWSLS